MHVGYGYTCHPQFTPPFNRLEALTDGMPYIEVDTQVSSNGEGVSLFRVSWAFLQYLLFFSAVFYYGWRASLYF